MANVNEQNMDLQENPWQGAGAPPLAAAEVTAAAAATPPAAINHDDGQGQMIWDGDAIVILGADGEDELRVFLDDNNEPVRAIQLGPNAPPEEAVPAYTTMAANETERFTQDFCARLTTAGNSIMRGCLRSITVGAAALAQAAMMGGVGNASEGGADVDAVFGAGASTIISMSASMRREYMGGAVNKLVDGYSKAEGCTVDWVRTYGDADRTISEPAPGEQHVFVENYRLFCTTPSHENDNGKDLDKCQTPNASVKLVARVEPLKV